MNGHTDLSTCDARRSHRLGLPLWTLAILALLGVPRVVLHDLGVIHEGTAPNLLLVVAPPLVWIAVVLAARVRRPFLTLLVTGALYGVLLGLAHQLLWGTAFPGGAPALLVPVAAARCSVRTGVVVGALAGLLAEAVRAVTRAAGAGR